MTRFDKISNDKPKPLSARKLRQKIARALKIYGYRLGKKNGKDELKSRNIIINDLLNVVKSSDSEIEPQWVEKWKKYRYAFDTELFCVVMTFDGPGYVVFITSWRKKKYGRAPDVK